MKLLEIMNKKQIIKGILIVVKYAVTLILGYLGGNGSFGELV